METREQRQDPSTRVIALHDAVVRFGADLAVGPITAELDAGSSVALVGANGSGKTTLLRLLAGLVEPTAGTVRRPPGTAVGYVAQHQHQHPWLPLAVREVVTSGCYGRTGLVHRLTAADRALVDGAMERLDVTRLRKRTFGSLSGGQRQRVLVATALAVDAPLLLLDEPITGLDIPSQEVILDLVAEERSRGRLVVLSTHHLDEARRCDRVVLLRGHVVADGAPADALTRAPLEAAFGAHSVGDSRSGIAVFDHHGHGVDETEGHP